MLRISFEHPLAGPGIGAHPSRGVPTAARLGGTTGPTGEKIVHLPSRTHRNPRSRRTLLAATCLPAAALLAVGLALPPAALASEGQSAGSMRDGTTAQALAEHLAEDGLSVSNASVSGNDVQLGTVRGLPTHGHAVADGVALSTGSLIDPDPQADSDVDFEMSSVLGPNKKLTTTGDLGGAGHEGLSTLAGEDTYDAATLSFDVTATASNLVLLYEFGSEEYAGEGGSGAGNPNKGSWQSQGFKDAVSIEVNGTNCALVPGTQTPVNAGTVNESSNARYYTPNVSGHQLGGIDVAFNGYTSTLVCQAAVTPGQSVHVSISIADTRDGQLDSTLLLPTNGLAFADSLPSDPCSSYGGNCDAPQPSPSAPPTTSQPTSAASSAAGSQGAGAGNGGADGGAGQGGAATASPAAAVAGQGAGRSGEPAVHQAGAAQAKPAVLAQAGAHSLPLTLGAGALVAAGAMLLWRRRRN